MTKVLMLPAATLVATSFVGTTMVSPVMQDKAVTIIVHRVRQIDNLDAEIDVSGPDNADFFAKITVDGHQTQTKNMSTDDGRPYWRVVSTYTGRYVPIKIELFDDDGGVEGKDDVADINRSSRAHGLHLTYDTSTGRVSGDVRGRKGSMLTSRGMQKNKAQIWFTIE